MTELPASPRCKGGGSVPHLSRPPSFSFTVLASFPSLLHVLLILPALSLRALPAKADSGRHEFLPSALSAQLSAGPYSETTCISDL